MTLKVLDLFSGIGGFSLGLERTGGFETVGFCENDRFCQRILAKCWPDTPIHDDITTMEFTEGQADVICGGFPCQDLSDAGQRAGLSGERSGLYRELVRAIRVVRPKFAIMENVAALLGRGLGQVLGDLAESGYDTEWDCVPACIVGAPHERDRIWIVAHPDSERRGEEGQLRHRPVEMPSRGATPGAVANPADTACQQVGATRQPRKRRGVEEQRPHTNPESIGCRQRGQRRPPDSFARVRDEARRNLADPYGARLAFREGLTRHAWEELPAVERDRLGDERQSIWPNEPALSRVDDGIPDWLDRVKATGNTIIPQIPEIIGHALLEANSDVRLKSEATRSDTGNADCRAACLTHNITSEIRS